jgi:aspartyl aminopeptidase
MESARPTKKELKKLSERLTYRPRLVWDLLGAEEKREVFSFAEEYKAFLDAGKTEREAVSFLRKAAGERGFSEDAGNASPTPLLRVFHGKSVALARPGRGPLEEGVRLLIAHIDAPRLDLKQNPLYEEVDLALLKTHYYGGIKKYQWLARPLALHGRVVKGDGTFLDIAVGEGEGDPVFTIPDLLPHLARKVQYEKKVEEAFPGEKLNLLVGSLPLGDPETKDRFKLAVLNHLHEVYGLVEEDLVSAELEIVPAGGARDVGWDRALVGGYGQDDRSSAFAALKALLDMEESEQTAVALFVDKEEVGSEGATGARSNFLESVVADLLSGRGNRDPRTREIHSILSRSKAISADVAGALDPDYPEVHEKRNAARMGYGLCITKFTGSRGKVGANDANAEYLGWLRALFNTQGVIWQAAELGKVDEGGGGTVAKHLALYGMEIVDCGPPVLSMHSPFELTHKGDLYMTYKGFRSFLEAP